MATVDMKLEVVIIGVTDVDRAKTFYKNLGCREDIDITHGEFRGVQMTPHNSSTSIIFGKGITAPEAGSTSGLVLAVKDIDAARRDLTSRGIDVSEVFHFAAGPFNNIVPNPRVSGRDPESRSYFSFASFEDPDGNSWVLQEITTRLPGREWKSETIDTATLADLLRETGQHHDGYEKTHGEHQWADWYAPYLGARLNGSSPEEATTAADRYMEKLPQK